MIYGSKIGAKAGTPIVLTTAASGSGTMLTATGGGGSTAVTLTPGIRNNNPGNLSPGKMLYENQKGLNGVFATFNNMQDGVNALGYDVWYKITKHNLNSLLKLFTMYLGVGTAGGHTMADAREYANFVNDYYVKKKDINQVIGKEDLFNIIKGIVRFENTQEMMNYVPDKLIQNAVTTTLAGSNSSTADNSDSSKTGLVVVLGVVIASYFVFK